MAFHAALAIALTSVNAAEPALRQPTGAWVVAFEKGMCLLQRSYGTETDPLTIVFRMFPTNPLIGLYLIGVAPKGSSPADSVLISFGPGTMAVESPVKSFRGRDKRVATTEVGLKRIELQQAETSGLLTLDAGSSFSHKFAVPGLRKAMAKADECATDLLLRWGVSRELLARTAQFPKANDHRVQPNDYPEDALRLGVGGEATARVRVNALGVASDCKIVNSSRLESLDRATCQVFLRTKYQPALDHERRPIDSMFVGTISWQVMTL